MKFKYTFFVIVTVIGVSSLNGQTALESKNKIMGFKAALAAMESLTPAHHGTQHAEGVLAIGRLDSSSNHIYDAGSWLPSSSDHYRYNNQKRLKQLYTEDPSREAVAEYYYDSTGFLTELIHKEGDSVSNSWTNTGRTTMSYNGNGQVDSRINWIWDSTASQWLRYTKVYYSYTASADYKLISRYYYDSSTQSWIYWYQSDYNYVAGRLVSAVHSDSSNGSLQAYYTRHYRHDNAGQIASWSAALYDDASMSWDSVRRATYGYDQNFNPTEERYFNYNDSTLSWDLSVGFNYYYDLNQNFDNLITPGRDHFYPDQRKQIINKPLSYTSFIWNDSLGQLSIYDTTVYHYSQQAVSLNEHTIESIDLYPNPATESFSFDLPDSERLSIEVYDAKGRIVLTGQVNNHSSLDVRHLPKGMYTVKLFGGEKLYSTSLIKH